jgi:hypothetical protein
MYINKFYVIKEYDPYFLAGIRLYLLHNVHNGSGAYPISSSMGTSSCFAGSEVAKA